jgi:hypothetical protein
VGIAAKNTALTAGKMKATNPQARYIPITRKMPSQILTLDSLIAVD